MASNLNVGQATAVRDLIRGLTAMAAGQPDDVYTPDRTADALALLANAAQARMMAGPGALDAREAIGALADRLDAASKPELTGGDAIEVTCRDLGTGETGTVRLKAGQFVVCCAEPAYVSAEQVYPGTKTNVVTISRGGRRG